jgi:hypothetical protein
MAECVSPEFKPQYWGKKKKPMLERWGDWDLNSGLHTCKAGTLLLKPHLQSILLWLFWRWGLAIYLHGLALNLDPPNLSLTNSKDYRYELPPTTSCVVQAGLKLMILLPHPLHLVDYQCASPRGAA